MLKGPLNTSPNCSLATSLLGGTGVSNSVQLLFCDVGHLVWLWKPWYKLQQGPVVSCSNAFNCTSNVSSTKVSEYTLSAFVSNYYSLREKWNPISYIAHHFWPETSKVVQCKGNRVPFGMRTCILAQLWKVSTGGKCLCKLWGCLTCRGSSKPVSHHHHSFKGK